LEAKTTTKRTETEKKRKRNEKKNRKRRNQRGIKRNYFLMQRTGLEQCWSPSNFSELPP
jgi:hypothetical protein